MLRLPLIKARHVPRILGLTARGQDKILEFWLNRRSAAATFLREGGKPIPQSTLDLARAHDHCLPERAKINLPERHKPLPRKILARAYNVSHHRISKWTQRVKALLAKQR